MDILKLWKRGIFFLIMMLCCVESAKYKFTQQKLTQNEYISKEVAMYSKEDTPAGKGESSVFLNLTLKQSTPTNKTLQILLFHEGMRKYVGKKIDDQHYLCCWKMFYNTSECNTEGSVILDPALLDMTTSFYSWQVPLSLSSNTTDPLTSQFIATTLIHKIGVWELYVVSCGIEQEVNTSQVVVVNGQTIWIQPYGHIPADSFAYLPLYFCLAFGYFVVGIIWISLSVKYKEGLMMLQHCLFAVIVSGCAENLTFSLDYVIYNRTGNISLGFNIFSVIFSTIKATISFVCILLVCNGFTVIKPTLDRKIKRYVSILGGCYFGFTAAYMFVDMLRYTPQTEYLNIPEGVEYLFLIPTTMLNFTFLLWTFYCLYETLNFLEDHKQPEKLKMFQRLGISLLVGYLISMVFFIIELSAYWANKYYQWWEGYWLFTGYWSMLHFVMLLVVGFLWRPNPSNKRYAYSSQLPDEVELPGRRETHTEHQNEDNHL